MAEQVDQVAAQQALAAAQDAAHQAHNDALAAAMAAQDAANIQHNVAVQAATGPTHHRVLGKLLNKPEPYDGKERMQCTTFIAQVKLYMSGNSESFPNEEAKVLFAATFLRGKAFAWFEPRMVRNVDPMLRDFDLFCSELLRNLGDPDRENTMARKLKTLRQTASASAYRTEFDNITQYLPWDDAALKSYFYDGLRSDVKDALSYIPNPPVEYREFQDLVIQIDNRLFERKQEARGNTPARPATTSSKFKPTYRPAYRASASSGPTPMDLDATRNKRFKPLTPQERTRRITENLCLYCGNAGHRAGECPAKRKPSRLSATLVAPRDSKN